MNGFLATGDDAWFERLAALIESPDLRHRTARRRAKRSSSATPWRRSVTTYLRLLRELTAAG